MRRARILPWLLCLLFSVTEVFAGQGVSTAGPGSISGVVRDSEGTSLAGARLTLTGAETQSTETHSTTSDAAGRYRFADVAAGEYRLAVELKGYVLNDPVVLRVRSSSDALTADLVVVRSVAAPSPAASPAPLEFQSSGLHGLIDPGGYSASSTAANVDVLRGIADVKRDDTGLAAEAETDWPCTLEPELRKAIAERPNDFQAHLRLGEFYLQHGQPNRAVRLLKRATELDTTSDAAIRELAVALLLAGQFQAARTLLAPLAERKDGPRVHELLARADEGSGLFRQAAEEYRKAESGEPGERPIFGMGYELILAGALDDARDAFDAGIQSYPRSIELRIGAGSVRSLQRDTSGALQQFLAATDVDPGDPRAYSFLASVSASSSEMTSEQHDRVRDAFRRFLEMKPNSAPANLYYAVALSRDDHPADQSRIETLLKRAVELDPALQRAHLELAEFYARRGDYIRAIPHYEAAIRLSPSPGEARYRLALAYKRVGRSDDSEREMKVFLADREAARKAPDQTETNGLAQFIPVTSEGTPDLKTVVPCSDVPNEAIRKVPRVLPEP